MPTHEPHPGRRIRELRAIGRALLRTGALRRLARANWREVLGQRVLGVASPPRVCALARPHKIATKDQHGAVTWAELDDRIDRLARLLRSRLGLRPGDVALVVLTSSTELIEVRAALARAEVSSAPVNPRSEPSRLRELSQASAAAAWIVDRSVVARPDPSWHTPVVVVPIEGSVDAAPALVGGPGLLAALCGPVDGRALQQLARLPLRCDDRHLVAAPMWLPNGPDLASLTLSLGGTVVIGPEVGAESDPAQFLSAVEEHRITTTAVSRSGLRAVSELSEATRARYDTSSLHAIFCLDAVPPALAARARQAFGHVLYDLNGAQADATSSHPRR